MKKMLKKIINHLIKVVFKIIMIILPLKSIILIMEMKTLIFYRWMQVKILIKIMKIKSSKTLIRTTITTMIIIIK